VFYQCSEHEGKPIYIQTTGKTALAPMKKLVGHGTSTHAEGFVANWKIRGINLAIRDELERFKYI
jgi:phenylalanine-4-hydroxylase